MNIDNNIDKDNLKKINLMYEVIANTFSKEISSNITHAKFFIKKNNNLYFIAKYLDQYVQIRIPIKKDEIWFNNEYKLVSKFKDYLFIKNGVFIKKWYQGTYLSNIKLGKGLIKPILSCIRNFQANEINIPNFDWNKNNIKDEKYKNLLAKYENEELVLSHNNIKKNNIIVNKFGYVKLFDFENISLNSKYYDLVALHLEVGLKKEEIIKFFKLDVSKFDDYIYLYEVYNEEIKKDLYSNNKKKNKKENELKKESQSNKNIPNSKFIVFKKFNGFNYRLDIDKIKNFYFVPSYIYNDKNHLIWRWINDSVPFVLRHKSARLLARVLRTCHESNIEFPSFNLNKQVEESLHKINLYKFKSEIRYPNLINKILYWLDNLVIDANCHNNLNPNNILPSDNENIFLIDWSLASRGNKFLDIAILFENLDVSKEHRMLFFNKYGFSEPRDFYKYRLIALFIGYLNNELTSKDELKSSQIIKKIRDVLNKNKDKI